MSQCDSDCKADLDDFLLIDQISKTKNTRHKIFDTKIILMPQTYLSRCKKFL